MAEIDVVLQRQWDMLKTLSRTENGHTLFELSKQFGVSEKTIKRDVKSIEAVFGKLKTRNEAHGRKRYLYDRNPFTFGLALDRNELLAIYIGQTLMTPLQGTFLWDGIRSGREKIKQILREDAVDYAERVAPFFFRMDPTERKIDRRRGAMIDEAFKSMEDSRALEIHYRSLRSQRVKVYEIHPYNFVYWRNSVYLVGYCCRDKKIKIWKVDRLSGARSIPNKKFKRVEFDIQKYLGNVVEPFVANTPVVNATVRFTGYAARIVQEENLKAVVSMVREDDDSIVTQIQTETGETFTRWILGFGSHAEILDPPELRQRFLGEVRKLEDSYSQEPKNIPAFPEKESEEKEEKPKKAAKKDKKEAKKAEKTPANKVAKARAKAEAERAILQEKPRRGRPRRKPIKYDDYEAELLRKYEDEEYASANEYDPREDARYEIDDEYDDYEEVVKPRRGASKTTDKKAFPAPAKRPVGRPRKETAEVAEPAPAKRPVGRPRKETVETAKPAPAAKRPVGRPRKETAEATEPTPAKRPVGRPRKETVEAAEPTPAKRPVGRPRKAVVATSTRLSTTTGKKRKASRAAGRTSKASAARRRGSRRSRRRGFRY